MKQASETTVYQRSISFLDADRKKAKVEVEITTRNGYPEFTASGEYNGGLGQCLDRIKPATKEQRELISLWNKWHLKSKKLPADFEEDLDTLLDTIEEHEEERAGEPLFTRFGDDDSVLELIEEQTTFTGRDAELCAALCKMFDLTENDLGDIEIDDNRVTVQGDDYLAGTDEEMDVEWDNELDNYLEECVYPDLPDNMRNYFDDERWKSDARMDGRGHSLNRYDGGEEEAEINGTSYYAYRQ